MNYLATTHAERKFLSAIVECVLGLVQFPDIWWQEMLRQPGILDLTPESFAAFRSMPPEARNWENPPSDRVGPPNESDEQTKDLRWSMSVIAESWAYLKAFWSLLEEIQKDDRYEIRQSKVEKLLEFYDGLFKHGDTTSQLLSEYWHDYEQSLRTKFGHTIQLPNIECRQSIMDLKDDIESIKKKKP
jgi:hypothetical protein